VVALIEQHGASLAPGPRSDHFAQRFTTPVARVEGLEFADAHIGFQIERTAQHIEPDRIVAPEQILLDLRVHQDVRVERIEVGLPGLDGLFEARAEQGDAWVLGRIGFHQE